VVPLVRLGVRHEAQRPAAVPGRWVVRSMITVKERPLGGLGLFTESLYFFGGVRIGIGSAGLYKFLSPLFVRIQALALPVRAEWAADVRSFVVRQSECFQAVH